ncbi:hypothetical protein GCM10010191_94550 [Actinomadura vinacea]|uniref:Protein kinase domain-containing protein n=1 Tax=Actinomadura vinacea TaxID=115336 RepID=A0ABN3KK51_9ACTN
MRRSVQAADRWKVTPMESRPGPGALRELQPHDPTRVGPYELDAKVGEGGMGAVYLGHGTDGRPVAVKVVRPELAGDRAFVARFNDECRNAERVASFCTAQVLDHGQDLGLAYMVTEYIEGPSLLRYIGDNGTLSPGMLHGVAVGVAAALVAIHAAGLVHRDLKPSNVLLSISGPRVIDFGIARALDMATSHTQTGQIVGTPGYIAPEQILTHQITPAVDIFAWGCLVAYAANGRNPFGRGSLQVMVGRALHGEPELGTLTGPLARLVKAALSKEPETRPSAQDLLLSLVGGGANEAAVTTTLGHSWPLPPPQGTPLSPGMPMPQGAPPPSQSASTRGGAAVSPPAGMPQGAVRGERVGTGGAVPQEVSPAPLTGSGSRASGPPQPDGAAGVDGSTGPAAETITDPALVGGVRVPPPPRRARGRRPAITGVAVAVLLAGGGFFLSRLGDDPGTARPPAKKAGGPPIEPMLVRIDTKAGWPKECHADIGTYTPGQAAPVTLLPGDACDTLPERSPADRNKVAFTRTAGGRTEAWVMNADGGDAQRVTGGLSGGRVTWSPDGRQLAFMRRDGGVRQIYAITIGETEPRRLTNDPADKDDPMWSSTGRLAFWSKRAGTEQIYTLDPRNPSAPWTRLSRDGVRAVDPEWSPDGTKIAYTRGPYPNGHVWVMNADGSGARRLTTGDRHEMDAAWSRDGKWICYARGSYESPEIRTIRVDGTGDRPFGPGKGMIGHPNWS